MSCGTLFGCVHCSSASHPASPMHKTWAKLQTQASRRITSVLLCCCGLLKSSSDCKQRGRQPWVWIPWAGFHYSIWKLYQCIHWPCVFYFICCHKMQSCIASQTLFPLPLSPFNTWNNWECLFKSEFRQTSFAVSVLWSPVSWDVPVVGSPWAVLSTHSFLTEATSELSISYSRQWSLAVCGREIIFCSQFGLLEDLRTSILIIFPLKATGGLQFWR